MPQPAHLEEQTIPAPADLEQVRRFLSLHEHVAGEPESLPPERSTLDRWFHDQGAVGRNDRIAGGDLAWAADVREALVSKARENMGEPRDDAAIGLLNEAAKETGLRPCFGSGDDSRLHTAIGGVRGAVGLMLGAAFLAELEGTWKRFRLCADPDCLTVFYDHSKNRSGKWCSMRSCGNRSKVRAFRERKMAGS